MKKGIFFLVSYWLLLMGMALFLYGLTAPNLVLLTWQPYWQWQTWMWQTFFDNRQLLAQTYVGLLLALVLSYGGLLVSLQQYQTELHVWVKKNTWRTLLYLIMGVAPLCIGMNGLSYDLFNYAFNAKMVVVYNANPYQQTALDFASDPWVRFMHNTHTPAPYGYTWTAVSLIPYTLGWGKLLPVWLAFKALNLLSWAALACWYIALRPVEKPEELWAALVVLLNPLMLIEVLMNAHNDLWMMVPALISLGIVSSVKLSTKPKALGLIGLSACLLLFSLSIKLATVVLIPVWIGIIVIQVPIQQRLIQQLYIFYRQYWPTIAAALLASLLLTERSKWFLPWYWLWVLVWLPVLPSGKFGALVRPVLVGFSISSLFRYVPYLSTGEYTQQVLHLQIGITFLGGIIVSGLLYLTQTLFLQPRRRG